jgi:tetratricopeptide (TPR) repeat protein
MKQGIEKAHAKELYLKALKGRALVLQHLGNVDDAMDDVRIMLSFCVKHFGSMHSLTIDAQLRIARIYAQGKSEYKRAEGILKKVLESPTSLSDDLLIDALLNTGYINHSKSNYDLALRYFLKALALSKRLDRTRKMEACHDYLGLTYLQIGDFDKAYEHHSKCLSLAKKLKDDLVVGKASNHLGVLFRERGDLDKALHFFTIHFEVSSKLGYKPGIGIAAGNIGNVFASRGELEKGLEYFNIDLSISEETGERRGVAIAANNIGIVYANKGEFAKALEYFEKYRLISNEIGYERGIANAHFNIGNIFQETGRMREAEKQYVKAEKMFGKTGDRLKVLAVLTNHAELNAAMKMRKKAVRMANEALKLAEELHATMYEVYVRHVLAKATAASSPEKAIVHYRKMIAMARKKNLMLELEKGLFELSLILKKRGESAKAKQCYREAKQLEEKTGYKLGR